MSDFFAPDFDKNCRICGRSPCVVVVGHKHQPHTDLCGVCFFDEPAMIDWADWNDQETGDTSDD